MSPSKHHNRRKGPHREPPTIDLKATVVDEGRTAAQTADAPQEDAGRTDAPSAAGPGIAAAPRPDEAQAAGAPSAAPSGAERGGAAPVATSDEAAAPVEMRTPFTTAMDAPQAVDQASTPAAPGDGPAAGAGPAGPGGAAQAMDDGRLPGTPSLSSGPDTADRPGSSGLAASGAGPDTLSDGTAVANEGPAPAADGATASSGAGREGAGAARDRAAVDATAPVADEDLTRSRGSVPPVSGPPGSGPRASGAAPAGPPPGRRSAGFGAMAGAGLLGGLVGAGLLYGLQTWRSAQEGADPRLAQIEQRLGALPRAEAMQGLDRRIAALEATRNELGQRIGAAQNLAERAAARAEEAANRPAPAGQAAPAADPAPELASRLAALEEQVRNPAPVGELANRVAALEEQVRNPAAAAEVSNRLGTLETQLRERAEASANADQALERRLAETSQNLERRLNEAVERLDGRIGETGQALERRVAEATQALERRLAETGQRTQALDRRLAETDERTQALSRQLAEWNPEAIRAGLRVVLADRLNDALAQGAPFADVLGSLRGFAIAPERAQALEPLAASGAPTAAALRQEFEPLAERIERAARGEAEGVADRLRRMADKVVSVRAVGDPNSTAVPDLVARIENALERGALREAAAAWDALPEAARRVAEEWGRRLKARLAAEEAARGVASDAIAALNAAGRR